MERLINIVRGRENKSLSFIFLIYMKFYASRLCDFDFIYYKNLFGDISENLNCDLGIHTAMDIEKKKILLIFDGEPEFDSINLIFRGNYKKRVCQFFKIKKIKSSVKRLPVIESFGSAGTMYWVKKNCIEYNSYLENLELTDSVIKLLSNYRIVKSKGKNHEIIYNNGNN